MSASTRDLERAAQVQFVRAQKAEQKAEDILHALNLTLNLGFERFHTALTMHGAVHECRIGSRLRFTSDPGLSKSVFGTSDRAPGTVNCSHRAR